MKTGVCAMEPLKTAQQGGIKRNPREQGVPGGRAAARVAEVKQVLTPNSRLESNQSYSCLLAELQQPRVR